MKLTHLEAVSLLSSFLSMHLISLLCKETKCIDNLIFSLVPGLCSFSVSRSIPHSSLLQCYELFFRDKELYKNGDFGTLEGFLKNGPQRVQIGHVKGPNGFKQHQKSFSLCWSSFFA